MSARRVCLRACLGLLPLVAGLVAGLALPAAAQSSEPPPPDPAGGPAAAVIDFPENGALRVASLADLFGAAAAGASGWTLGGPDAALFEVDAGALRFAVFARGLDRHRLLPDFEAPADADGDNRYEATLAPAGAEENTRRIVVRIVDRDEPGRVSLPAARPSQGVALTAALSDPDGPLERVAWRWERSTGPETFAVIEGAETARYVPVAADTGRHLRAVARYADRHGGGRTVSAASRAAVLGPQLVALSARSEGFPGRGLHPAFDPAVTHYAVPCAETDALTLEWTAPADAWTDVDGVQSRPGRTGGAARAVTETTDVVLTLADADGAATRYRVHCVPETLAGIRTSGPAPEPLLAVTVGTWAAIIDEFGVPRLHRRAGGSFFLRTFGLGPARRWAHGMAKDTGAEKTEAGNGFAWTLLDAGFRPLRRIATAPPLRTTGRHDFRLLADGAALLMAFEPAVRDFSFVSDPRPAAVRFDDPEGKPWGAAVKTRDSAIQIVGPDGSARWTWNSWGRMPLEDCAQHRFPMDWAHVNSVEMTPGGRVLASLRGCSSVLLLDPAAPAGGETVWRIGQSNLTAADWAARGLGPAPWPVVGDPEGAFCAQHAASLLTTSAPEPRLLMFDNGVHCVEDPSTGEPLTRRGGEYSRAVEYALDETHGEAAFVRERSHEGRRAVLGHARGHVEALPDGTWLVSWGKPGSPGDSERVDLDSATASLVDPASGAKRFAVLRGGQGLEMTALPVPRAVLADAPPALGAAFPGGAPPAAHGGGADLWVAVAFTRPVAAFGPETPSVAVEGGELVSVRPWRAFGRPAHAWLLGLRADDGKGGGPATLRLVPGRSCAAGGICAADGATLARVPAPLSVESVPQADPYKETVRR